MIRKEIVGGKECKMESDGHDFPRFPAILRGHLGVPDTVSGPLNVPLYYLVILHKIQLKAYILWNTDKCWYFKMENGQK